MPYINPPAVTSDGLPIYATAGDLPVSATDGTTAYVVADSSIYAYDTGLPGWKIVSSAGSVSSSTAPSTDNRAVVYDGTTGTLIKQSPVTIGVTGNVTGIVDLTATGTTTLNTGLTGVAKLASGVVSASAVNLTSEVTGTLPVANGGTNSATALNNNRVMTSSGGAIVEAAAITATRALVSNASGIPVASTITTSEVQTLTGINTGTTVQAQLDSKQSATLTSAHILVGNGSNVATDVAVSGDLTAANTGAFTVATVGTSTAANIHSAELLANAATDLNTASAIVKRDGSGNFTAGTVTVGQLIDSGLTASTVPYADASKQLTSSAITPSELGTLTGINTGTTIQAQLNGKAPVILPTTNQAVFVNYLAGSNVTGDGSFNKPWQTIAYAMTQITDATQNKPYVVILLGSRQIETGDVFIKPYTSIAGQGQRASYLRVNGGSIKPDTSFGSSTGWVNISNIYLGGSTAINWDLQALGGSNSTFVIQNCTLTGAMTFKGRNAGGGDFLEVYMGLSIGTFTVDSTYYQIQSFEFGNTFTNTNTQAVAGLSGSINNATFDVSAAITDVSTVYLNNIAYASGATITTTGTVTLESYRGLPVTSARTLSGGTTVTNRDNATIVPFTPTTSGDWSSVPTNAQLALDTLASSGAVKSQTAKFALAAPNGSAGVPSFRQLQASDLSDGLSNALATNHVFVGSAGGVATDVAMSGDVSIVASGATTVNTVGTSSAANIHSAELLANAATDLNTASAIVKRDASGNFAAGTITASLSGNATTATTATNFSGSLSGDVTGTQGATVVGTVGGETAANVAAGAVLANNATNANTASAIVRRDASGNFSANTITANLTGNCSGSAASFTGTLSGDVTGTQGATAIAATTVTGKAITGFVSGAGVITASDTILTAINKLDGNIAAIGGGGLSATVVAGGGTTTLPSVAAAGTVYEYFVTGDSWQTFNANNGSLVTKMCAGMVQFIVKNTNPTTPSDWIVSAAQGRYISNIALPIAATGGGLAKGTIIADGYTYRREGCELVIRGRYAQSTAGSAGTGTYLITLPASLTIDDMLSAASTGTGSFNDNYGYFRVTTDYTQNFGNGDTNVRNFGFVSPYDANSIKFALNNAFATGGYNWDSLGVGFSFGGASMGAQFEARIPVVEFRIG